MKRNPNNINEQITFKLIKRQEVSRDSTIYSFELPQEMHFGLDVCKHIAIEYH